MAVVGSLLIEMSANVARLQKDMASARSSVNVATRGINSAIQTTKSALGALGLGLGAVGLYHLVSGAIDAQDELSKLSQKLNISVESLAGWRHAANLSGVEGDAFTKGIKSLASQMFDASSGLLESKRYFSALNIEIEKSPGVLKDTDAVLIELADRFQNMADGTAKSALAVKLLGKAGLDMIPLLNQGSAAIREMIAEGKRLNPVTAESAKAAEEFNDNMTRVSGTLKGAFISAMNKALPDIAEISKAMAQAAKDAGFWEAALVGLGGAISHIYFATDLQKAGKEFADLTSRLLDLQNARDRTAKGGFTSLLPTLDAQIASTKKQLAEVQKLRDALSDDSAAPGPKKPTFTPTIVDDAATKKAIADAAKEYDWLMARLQEGEDEWQNTLTEAWKAWENYVKKTGDEAAAGQTEMWKQVFDEIDAEQERAIQAGQDYLNATEGVTNEITEFWKQAARSMQSSMSDFFFDVMQGNLFDLAGSFKKTIDRMVADQLAAQAATQLFGADFGKGGSIGGLVGKVLGSFATGTSYVPQTGPYILHQGEKVVPAAQNDGGMVVNQTFHVAGAIDGRSQAQIAASAAEGLRRAAARNT